MIIEIINCVRNIGKVITIYRFVTPLFHVKHFTYLHFHNALSGITIKYMK